MYLEFIYQYIMHEFRGLEYIDGIHLTNKAYLIIDHILHVSLMPNIQSLTHF